MVYQLIYSSALNASITDPVIVEIARNAQLKNSRINVTGMMVCHQGSILQVLEGDKLAVLTLYDKICVDNRHSQMLPLIRRDTESREFADWAMGFKHLPNNISDPDALPLLAKSYQNILPDNASDIIRSISRSFARVNGIDYTCG